MARPGSIPLIKESVLCRYIPTSKVRRTVAQFIPVTTILYIKINNKILFLLVGFTSVRGSLRIGEVKLLAQERQVTSF